MNWKNYRKGVKFDAVFLFIETQYRLNRNSIDSLGKNKYSKVLVC
jgi:hypothetical protein